VQLNSRDASVVHESKSNSASISLTVYTDSVVVGIIFQVGAFALEMLGTESFAPFFGDEEKLRTNNPLILLWRPNILCVVGRVVLF
jgi:hypothetical protein